MQCDIRLGNRICKGQCNICIHWKFSDRKDRPASVEERLYKTDTTSPLKRTAAVIADILIKDQVTDKNDTLEKE